MTLAGGYAVISNSVSVCHRDRNELELGNGRALCEQASLAASYLGCVGRLLSELQPQPKLRKVLSFQHILCSSTLLIRMRHLVAYTIIIILVAIFKSPPATLFPTLKLHKQTTGISLQNKYLWQMIKEQALSTFLYLVSSCHNPLLQ